MKIGSLFSGIGGLELGLERAGLGHVVWQCEIDPFCRDVLARHWPEAQRYGDITSLHAPSSVDVMCGGFPCQDVSLAGKNAGMENGTRSGLWAEYARIIGETRPKIVVIENVPGLLQRGLRRVLADLAGLGYDAEWAALSAADVGAPHLRRRIFIVATDPERIDVRQQPGWLERACRAHSPESIDDGEGGDAPDAESLHGRRDTDEPRAGGSEPPGSRSAGDAPDADRERELQPGRRFDPQWRRSSDGGWRPPVSPIRRVDARVSDRMDGDLDAKNSGQDGSKVVSGLRDVDGTQAIQRQTRGSGRIRAAAEVQPVVRQYESRSDRLGPYEESTDAQRRIVRDVRRDVMPGHAPLRSGQEEQRSEQSPDAMRKLSPDLALESSASWCVPRGSSIPSRNHGKRLKALGNAVVPQCAEVIGRAILDAIGDGHE